MPLSKKLELLTSLEDFDALHLIADGRRAVVRVDRQALLNLLLDHSSLLNVVPSGTQITSPPPKVRRVEILN